MKGLKIEEVKFMRVPVEIVPVVQTLLQSHREKMKAAKVHEGRPEWYFRAIGLAKEIGFEKLKQMGNVEFFNEANVLYPELTRYFGYQAYYDALAEMNNGQVITTAAQGENNG